MHFYVINQTWLETSFKHFPTTALRIRFHWCFCFSVKLHGRDNQLPARRHRDRFHQTKNLSWLCSSRPPRLVDCNYRLQSRVSLPVMIGQFPFLSCCSYHHCRWILRNWFALEAASLLLLVRSESPSAKIGKLHIIKRRSLSFCFFAQRSISEHGSGYEWSKLHVNAR